MGTSNNEKFLNQTIYGVLNNVGFGREVSDSFIKNHLLETPARMIKAWEEMLDGYNMNVDMKLSPHSNSYDWIGMTNIEFSSLCAHHWLPFSGTVDILYVPSTMICGASKLARIVDMYSHRLQLQEFLTAEIFNHINDELKPKKLGIRIISKHSCVGCRGVRARNSQFVTYGISTNSEKADFLGAIPHV